MSGPKISIYTLTPAQLEVLRRQMEEELKRLEEEERLRREINRIFVQLAEGRKWVEKMDEELQSYKETSQLMIEWKQDASVQDRISDIKLKLEKIVEKIRETYRKTDIDSLQAGRDLILKDIESVRDEILLMSSFVSDKREQLDAALSGTVSTGFEQFMGQKKLSEQISAQEQEKLQNIDFKWLNRIDELVCKEVKISSVLKERLKAAGEQLMHITDYEFACNFAAIELQPLIEQAEKAQAFYLDYGGEYERLSARYEILCKTLKTDSESHVFPFDQKGLDQLSAEISRMEKQRLEAAEREYISDEMTAVMEEMGYDILGSREVIKKSGTKFLNELYDYGNGNAVNITYASDGKITMELGKMDSSDRIPDTSEKAVLVGTMTEFCSRFREIEDHLAEKGILAEKRLSLMPPDEAFAQIINTEDYILYQNKRENEEKRRKERNVKSRYID